MSEDRFTVEVEGKRAPKPGRERKPRQAGVFSAVLRGLWGLLRGLGRLRGPRSSLLVAIVLGYVLVAYGTPHILYTYQCSNAGTPGQRCYECQYIGIQGTRPHMGDEWDCPAVAMLPVNWRAIYGWLFDG